MRPIRYTEALADEFIRGGYWTADSFYDCYERNALALGEREALVDSRYRLSWAEAARLTDAIAAAWVADGIARDSRVLIQAPNSVWGFLARIACERAGLIALTVMPCMGAAEIEHFIARTEPALAVIPGRLGDVDYHAMYQAIGRRVPCLRHLYLFDEEAPTGARSLPATARAGLGRADPGVLAARRFNPFWDVALITATTGTAGLPKLVEWPLAPRLCTARARVEQWQLGRSDVTMAIAPHAGQAAGTLSYFAAPLAGAKTVLLEEFEPRLALEVMAREKVTAIGVAPAHLLDMLGQPVEDYDLSALRLIRSAGGFLPPHLAEEAESRFGAAICSDFGSHDRGAVSGCRLYDAGELRRRTVGHMLPGNQLRLKDGAGGEVPRGEPGRLWFRGPHAPAGYWRDAVLTAGIFDGEGWCATEDIVVLDRGCLWMLGRAGDVIRRGDREVYPAELEGLLHEHPAVLAAAVVGYAEAAGEERICAFVLPRPGHGFGGDDLAGFLAGKGVARFKFPDRLEILGSMPTIRDSGRVDTAALRQRLQAHLQEA